MKDKEVYINRFMKKILITKSCWLWQGSKRNFGYGQFCMNGKRWDAHRASWVLFKGEIPKGMCICHNCPEGDNPSCVNPEHLFLGTQGDNIRDIFKKNRGNPPVCERSRTAVLTKDKVLEMRELRRKGLLYKEIASLYKISPSTALYAIKGETWCKIDLLKDRKK